MAFGAKMGRTSFDYYGVEISLAGNPMDNLASMVQVVANQGNGSVLTWDKN
jgi:hypothetical protein